MAEYRVTKNIGVISLRNGPLNPLAERTRQKIYEGLKQARADGVDAIVICGSGKHFSVGADITEFDGGSMKLPLYELLDDIENTKIPVVAAVSGYALGGGLELALACHYRIASADAAVGLPEVNLGILPGAGGTQRLPRLVGLDVAMDWITTGKRHTASEAAKLGIFDRIVPKGADVKSEAISFARAVSKKSVIGRRTCNKLPPDSKNVEDIASKYLKIVYKRSRGHHGPAYCVQAVKHAALSDFREGSNKERELLMLLMTSGQRKALTYAFFAERRIQKWIVPGTNMSWQNSRPKDVKLGAVIGLGTMGRGIVINFLRAGIPVIVSEMNEKFLKTGLEAIHAIIDDMERRGIIAKQQNTRMKDSVTGTLDYSDLKDVDLVIEAVFEDIGLKQKVFRALDNACKPDTILASNTSAQNIDDIASATSRPDKVMGMHFFAPANLMRLLENVHGSKTSGDTIATCMEMGKRMGKVTVLVGNCYGFVGNRMYFNYTAEAEYLVEEGASPAEVDKALTDFGFAMGKFLVADLSGQDIGYRLRMALGVTAKQQPPGAKENERGGMRYCPLSDYLCEKGRYGIKTGKGWYDYPNGRVPQASPEVMKIIHDYRERIGTTSRAIDHQEILDRMLLVLINEGFRVLDDGIACSPMDIDMVWLHGYAWPKHTGGPMFHAHTIGLPKVLERVESFNKRFGGRVHYWKPSKMLVRLVTEHGNPDMSLWMQCSSAVRQKRPNSNL